MFHVSWWALLAMASSYCKHKHFSINSQLGALAKWKCHLNDQGLQTEIWGRKTVVRKLLKMKHPMTSLTALQNQSRSQFWSRFYLLTSKPLRAPKVLSSDFVSFTNLNTKAAVRLLFSAPICVLNLGEIFVRQPDSLHSSRKSNCRGMIIAPHWTIGGSVHRAYHQTNISKRILKLREAQMILAVDVLRFQLQSKGMGPA